MAICLQYLICLIDWLSQFSEWLFISSGLTACPVPMPFSGRKCWLLGIIQCLIKEERRKLSSRKSQPRYMFLTALQISSFSDEIAHRKSACSSLSQSNIWGKTWTSQFCLPICLASFPFHTDRDFFLVAVNDFTKPRSFYLWLQEIRVYLNTIVEAFWLSYRAPELLASWLEAVVLSHHGINGTRKPMVLLIKIAD